MLATPVSLVIITKYCNALCANVLHRDSELVAGRPGRAMFASSTTMQVALPLPCKSPTSFDRVFSFSLLDNLSIRAVMAEDIGVAAGAATLSEFVPTATALARPPRLEATFPEFA